MNRTRRGNPGQTRVKKANRVSRSAKLGFCLLAAGLAGGYAGDLPPEAERAQSVAGSDGALSKPAAYLRNWVESPPWIKKAIWRVSGNSEHVTTSDRHGRFVDGGPVPGWMHFEGSLQPGGFYIKFGSNSSVYAEWIFDRARNPVRFRINSPPPGRELVLGLGGEYYWHLWPDRGSQAQGLTIAPREGVPGCSPQNGTMRLCQRQRLVHLESLRRMGLWQLTDASPIRWTADGSFTAETEEHGQINGRITSVTAADRPRMVQYSVSRPAKMTFWVFYEYEGQMSPDAPPREMIRWSDRDPELKITNVVDYWEAGLDDQQRMGYLPSQFGAGSFPLVEFLVWSNGHRYYVQGEGPMREAIPWHEQPRHSVFGLLSPWTWLLLVGLSAGAGLFIRRWRRRVAR